MSPVPVIFSDGHDPGPTNKVKHDLDRRRWQAHVEPGNATVHRSGPAAPAHLCGAPCHVGLPSRDPIQNVFLKSQSNLECGFVLQTHSSLHRRRRLSGLEDHHGPKTQGLGPGLSVDATGLPPLHYPLKPRHNHLKSWRTAGTRRSKHIEQSKQGIPSHVEQPHTGYRTDDECRKLMARSDIELSRDRSVQPRSTDGQPPALCCSGFSRLLKLGNSRGPEPAARRRAPGAELIDPQRGTDCNCLRDGGETDDFA
ncbi:hypothetical protein FDECE_11015 [Fusarium decemcellulare]|nr:hypothetical protein FDECE_11015 [Fusarium decemcellulare]